MSLITSYTEEKHEAYIGSKKITLTELTPVFTSEEECAKNKKSIEHNLYQIFAKYSHN